MTQISVAVWHPPTCAGCLGTGKCWVCLGTGSIAVPDSSPNRCKRCDGSGRCAEAIPAPDPTLGLPA